MMPVYEQVKKIILYGSLFPSYELGVGLGSLKIPDAVWEKFIDGFLGYANKQNLDTLEFWEDLFDLDCGDYRLYEFIDDSVDKDTYTFKVLVSHAWLNRPKLDTQVPLIFSIQHTKKFKDPQKIYDLEASITVTPIVRTNWMDFKIIIKEWQDFKMLESFDPCI